MHRAPPATRAFNLQRAVPSLSLKPHTHAFCSSSFTAQSHRLLFKRLPRSVCFSLEGGREEVSSSRTRPSHALTRSRRLVVLLHHPRHRPSSSSKIPITASKSRALQLTRDTADTAKSDFREELALSWQSAVKEPTLGPHSQLSSTGLGAQRSTAQRQLPTGRSLLSPLQLPFSLQC